MGCLLVECSSSWLVYPVLPQARDVWKVPVYEQVVFPTCWMCQNHAEPGWGSHRFVPLIWVVRLCIANVNKAWRVPSIKWAIPWKEDRPNQQLAAAYDWLIVKSDRARIVNTQTSCKYPPGAGTTFADANNWLEHHQSWFCRFTHCFCTRSMHIEPYNTFECHADLEQQCFEEYYATKVIRRSSTIRSILRSFKPRSDGLHDYGSPARRMTLVTATGFSRHKPVMTGVIRWLRRWTLTCNLQKHEFSWNADRHWSLKVEENKEYVTNPQSFELSHMMKTCWIRGQWYYSLDCPYVKTLVGTFAVEKWLWMLTQLYSTVEIIFMVAVSPSMQDSSFSDVIGMSALNGIMHI